MQSEQAVAADRDSRANLGPGAGSLTIALSLPVLTRISYWLKMKVFQIFVDIVLHFRQLPQSDRPTYTKRYPVRPEVEVRVFMPSSFEPGRSRLLPLYVDIHGGGWVISNAKEDDADHAILANQHGICCVAISYRRAPSYAFPTAVHDCAHLIEAVLADKELDGIVDKTNVAVGGYSAGGNLALASVQLRDLSKRIKGLVAIYPITDLTRTFEHKVKTGKLAPGKTADGLGSLGPMFNYAYIPAGTDYRNPLLSPIFAERGDLPEKVCLIGCEYDLLCEEAKAMAERLAVLEGGETRVSADGHSWEKGNVRWEMVPGAEHGFNQPHPGTPEAQRARSREMQQALHRSIADWLRQEVYL